LDGLQDARRLGWIASAALARRRPERVAVTGLLSSGFSLRSSGRSDQDLLSSFTPNDAKCKVQSVPFGATSHRRAPRPRGRKG
jgi:hypothetical protein